MNIRKVLLGRDRPNQAQLKAVSRLCFQSGLLVFSVSVLGYFFPNVVVPIDREDVMIGLSFTMVLWVWGIRLLKGVNDR